MRPRQDLAKHLHVCVPPSDTHTDVHARAHSKITIKIRFNVVHVARSYLRIYFHTVAARTERLGSMEMRRWFCAHREKNKNTRTAHRTHASMSDVRDLCGSFFAVLSLVPFSNHNFRDEYEFCRAQGRVCHSPQCSRLETLRAFACNYGAADLRGTPFAATPNRNTV